MTDARARWRRLRLGAATLLGPRPQGFFIPHRYAAAVVPPGAYPALEPIFAAAADGMGEIVRLAAGHAETFAGFGRAPPPAPRWDQDWFPRLDGAVAYALVRARAPARIVEIGSGHSTRFLARAVADGALATRLTAIDPAPRAALAGLRVDWVRAPLQAAPRAPIEALAAGDLLFVDSSHILMPGTDVDLLLNDILPALPAGVLVHFHDVFLPGPYPDAWAWRGYNEQNALAGWLASGALRPLWASRYAATRLAGEIAVAGLDRLPLPAGAFESSLWVVKAK